MKNKTFAVIAAVVVQLVIILGLVGYYQGIVDTGDVVYLPIEPLDPTDPFRGDYVEFRIQAERVPVESFRIDTDLTEVRNQYPIGTQVWVELGPYPQDGEAYSGESGRKYSYPQRAELTKIERGVENERKWIKGVVQGYDESNNFGYSQYFLRVSYGIEQYFIPEGTGRTVDFRNKEAVAEVRIGEDGTPVLTQVFLDGTPWP